MKSLLLLTLIFFACSTVLFAQNEPRNCPTITIKTPYGPLRLDMELELGVGVDPPEIAGKLELVWQLSNGVFVSGQRTQKPTILMAKELAGTNVRISVTISGLPSGCPSEFWEDVGVEVVRPFEHPDGFGNRNSDDVKAHIDNFFIQINNSPHSEGLILVTFGEDESERTRLQRLERIFKAVSFRSYDVTRLTFLINKDFGIPITHLLLQPPNADLPGTREKTTLIKGEDLIRNPKKALPKKRTQ